MKVSIFGLGYVGAVTAGCLTKVGHTVLGVDVQAEKVESLASGVSPIIEPELDGLLAEAAKNGLLSATQNHEQAIKTTDVSLVCVGTPSAENGELNLQFVRQVTGQIADTVRVSGKSHDLVLRSTMLPGSTQKIADDLLAEAARHIARYKLPKAFVFLDEVVRSPSGKADYRWAKQQAEDAAAG